MYVIVFIVMHVLLRRRTSHSLLSARPNLHTFPPGTVWRTNTAMFHETLRAFYLGRLVAERYGHRVPIGGAVVKSALKYVAHRGHSPLYPDNVRRTGGGGGDGDGGAEEDNRRRAREEWCIFTPEDILPFLPPAVSTALKNRAGGARSNLSQALVSLSRFNYPLVVMEVEEARGHAKGGSLRSLRDSWGRVWWRGFCTG